MPLDKNTLQQSILSLMSDMRTRTEVSDAEFARSLASIIDTYVKTATITVPAGIAVATSGSPTAQTGATTATAIAEIQ